MCRAFVRLYFKGVWVCRAFVRLCFKGVSMWRAFERLCLNGSASRGVWLWRAFEICTDAPTEVRERLGGRVESQRWDGIAQSAPSHPMLLGVCPLYIDLLVAL